MAIPRYVQRYPNSDTIFPFYMWFKRIKHQVTSPHRHDFFEFSLVVGGTGTEYINGIPYPMEPGSFTLMMPYQIHEIHSNPMQPLMIYNCNFTLDFLFGSSLNNELRNAILQTNERFCPNIRLGDEDYVYVEQLLKQMHREFEDTQPLKKTLLQNKLSEVLIFYLRKSYLASGSDTDTVVKRSNSYYVWETIYYIHVHYYENVTLTDIAKEHQISVSYLSSLIKATTGEHFLDILHKTRIRYACALLTASKMNVADIAYEVGYGSYKTFSRIFHSMKGIPPTEYRKHHTERTTS